MTRTLLILFLLLFAPGDKAVAQNRSASPDPAYIREFPDEITVRLYANLKTSPFQLSDHHLKDQLVYRDNSRPFIGIGATYRHFSLNITVPNPAVPDKKDVYGETRKFDAQIHSYSRKLAVDAYIEGYDGYYLGNRDKVTFNPGPQEFPYFHDLRTVTVGAAALYVPNGDQFSIRAPFVQDELQLRSAGSFLLGAGIMTHFITNDGGNIIPVPLSQPSLFAGRSMKDISVYAVTVNGGYGGTLVLGKHFFTTLAADIGFGPDYSQVKDLGDKTESKLGWMGALNARFGIGYNSEKWFGGFYFIAHADRSSLAYANASLETVQGIARLLIARRINAPRWMKRSKVLN